MLYLEQALISTMSWRSIPSCFLVLCTTLFAQESQPSEQSSASHAIGDWPQKLAWPRDQNRPICIVAGRVLTLNDVLEHIEKRHRPGLRKFIATPAGQLRLGHPTMATWVRQFADITCLEMEAKSRGIDPKVIEEALSHELKHGFEDWLQGYLQERERSGHPLELTQNRINTLLNDFQNREGLRTELDGWLNAIVPPIDVNDRKMLLDFYASHATIFGGAVTISHILIQHRDPRTLELLTGEARTRALAKVASVRARLKPDGSNFEEVATLMSDDRRTARKGGILSAVQRFDRRLPAAICRTGWNLTDGKFKGPVETPYGIEFIKRLFLKHEYYVVNPNDEYRLTIAATKRRLEQETLVFELREKFGLRLLY